MEFYRFIESYFPGANIADHTEYEYERDFTSPDNITFNQVLSWPPNIFIILHSVIDYTDKYRLLVSPQSHIHWRAESNSTCDDLVESWRSYLDKMVSKKSSFLDKNFILKRQIDTIFQRKNFYKCIYELMNEPAFSVSVFTLLISIDKLFSKTSDSYLYEEIYGAMIARDISYQFLSLENSKFESSFISLSDNDPKFGVITRKFNTPQSGLTINNLTQNLTFIRPAVKYNHHVNKVEKSIYLKNSHNILVIPWPFEVKDEYFTPSKNLENDMDSYFDFFDYHPNDDFSEIHFLSFLLSAIKRVGIVDLIVFPECSLSESQFKKLTKLLFDIFNKDAPSLLSGVYGKDGVNGKNSAVLGFVDEDLLAFNTITQEKHHRWFLDRNQLRNYNLSGSLNPGKKWWENISVGRRNLRTLETAQGVILCPLICEDLARQEPVAQAVRAVGPNLVVSLLLDGPQIAPRWPGKYAAVLSDDPGCSVLSVTALGMTLRATGLGHAPSKDIALWSEPGKPSEPLQVSSTSGALVLELEIENTKMWSLDGRHEIKPILRKKMHTTLELDFKNRNISSLKRMLTDAIEAGGNYVR